MHTPTAPALFTSPAARGDEWWRGCAVYQIYPRSFADANGDGVGDLAGITARLGHIAELGADAIWISPFFRSPMADFGYDVADYCDVDPIFGSLADFDALVARAHALGLKVTIDLVFAHTSDQHAWFAASRASRENPHADWYVWADPKADGTPPNNWQSVFGGPAWTWDARRGQYYYHQFLKEQPQLNCHNPAVQEALLAAMRFWLERGVDGFRLDALNHSMFDPALTDNPPAHDDGTARTRSYDFQEKRYSMSHPGVVGFVERIAALCGEYGAIFTVAEVGGGHAEAEMKAYTAGDHRLSSAYGFNFLYAPQLTPGLVAEALGQWQGEPGADGLAQGWPSWAFENHDAPRAASRWVPAGADAATRAAYCRMKMLLLACLRGNIFLYQGEELGLTQVEIPFERLRDPEAIANWPLTLSRDGARTPMPWQAGAAHLGFSPPGASAEPWLPLGADHAALAVDRQAADPDSLLRWTQAMLALRKAHRALATGALAMHAAPAPLIAFERSGAGERLLCVFNLTDAPQAWAPEGAWQVLASTGMLADGHFGPFSGMVARHHG